MWVFVMHTPEFKRKYENHAAYATKELCDACHFDPE